jgi:AraC-like DNA-binding protein
MDVLSDVLRAIRLRGALFLNAELRAPWCVQVPQRADLLAVLQPQARRLAICHMVLEGRCWVQLREGGEPQELIAGDVVTIPRADSHVLGSGLQHAAVHIDHIVQPGFPELRRVRYGGGGESTVVACGWFAYEGDAPNPLTENLPRLFKTGIRERPAGPWIEHSIQFALAEATGNRPGFDALASRAAEVLFLEALRGYIEALPPERTGWLAGLRDPVVGRCLALMHESPARDWSVDTLAQAVNLSRSALAERFTRHAGVPPMQYLTRWRMVVAAGQLRNELSHLARIASGVGYESEAAFNRAFKREFGVTPGEWRRQRRPKKACT